ncbi:MAG: nitrilase-related carbon-nitrogen hydrolase [Desulfobacteraceae bacterium]|jgi:N-carbamoylputrescine amidase
MRDIKIAAVCMNSRVGEIERNLDRTEAFVSRASDAGAHIICFPELSITGYVLKDPSRVYSDAFPGQILEKVEAMAREKGLIVIAGLIEMADGERPYISQVVAGPEGLLGFYRKTHLSPKEKETYQAGEEICVFRCGETVFGIQLCYEAHFPEISTLMALKGAEIIFMPHASPRGTPREKLQSWLRHLPGRAFDNAFYVVACNQVGKTGQGFNFPGVGVALSPAGKVMGKYVGTQEEMLLVDLQRDEIEEIRKHRMAYFIPNRRPELYTELSSKSR